MPLNGSTPKPRPACSDGCSRPSPAPAIESLAVAIALLTDTDVERNVSARLPALGIALGPIDGPFRRSWPWVFDRNDLPPSLLHSALGIAMDAATERRSDEQLVSFGQAFTRIQSDGDFHVHPQAHGLASAYARVLASTPYPDSVPALIDGLYFCASACADTGTSDLWNDEAFRRVLFLTLQSTEPSDVERFARTLPILGPLSRVRESAEKALEMILAKQDRPFFGGLHQSPPPEPALGSALAAIVARLAADQRLEVTNEIVRVWATAESSASQAQLNLALSKIFDGIEDPEHAREVVETLMLSDFVLDRYDWGLAESVQRLARSLSEPDDIARTAARQISESPDPQHLRLPSLILAELTRGSTARTGRVEVLRNLEQAFERDPGDLAPEVFQAYLRTLVELTPDEIAERVAVAETLLAHLSSLGSFAASDAEDLEPIIRTILAAVSADAAMSRWQMVLPALAEEGARVLSSPHLAGLVQLHSFLAARIPRDQRGAAKEVLQASIADAAEAGAVRTLVSCFVHFAEVVEVADVAEILNRPQIGGSQELSSFVVETLGPAVGYDVGRGPEPWSFLEWSR